MAKILVVLVGNSHRFFAARFRKDLPQGRGEAAEDDGGLLEAGGNQDRHAWPQSEEDPVGAGPGGGGCLPGQEGGS